MAGYAEVMFFAQTYSAARNQKNRTDRFCFFDIVLPVSGSEKVAV